MEINRNTMLLATKLMEKEMVINKQPRNPTTLQPNFFSTGGKNGPTKQLYNYIGKLECMRNRKIIMPLFPTTPFSEKYVDS